MASLCTVDSCRERLGIPDTKDDEFLLRCINWAGGYFADFCNRDFDRFAGALQQFDADETTILLRRYPVEGVTSFQLQVRNAWVDADDVEWRVDPASGVLRLDGALGNENQIARVLYTGGYVLPGNEVGDGQTALPAHLEAACIEQVAAWYQAKDRLGVTSMSAGGGSITNYSKLTLLPMVEETLQGFKRLRMI